MHTQTELVSVDNVNIRMITSDALKDTSLPCNNNNNMISSCERKEKDTVNDRRRNKRNQTDNNNSGYHSLSPRRQNSNNNNNNNINSVGRQTQTTHFIQLPLSNQNGGNNMNNNRQTNNNRNNDQLNYSNSKTHPLDTNNNNQNGSINPSVVINNQQQQQHQQNQMNGNYNGYKMQNEYQDGKKHMQKPQRHYVNKAVHVGNSYDNHQNSNVAYNGKLLRNDSVGGGEGDSHKILNDSVINDAATRKYSTDFLKHVGHQYNVNTIISNPVMKNHLVDDQNMLIKLKFGDNTHIFNTLGQQQQQQQHQQNFMRYQQQQLQQRMQLYHRHEQQQQQQQQQQQSNYQRNQVVNHQNQTNHHVFNNSSSNTSNNQNKNETELSYHHSQQQQQSRDIRSYHNSYYQQQPVHQQQNNNNTYHNQNRGKNNNGGNRDHYRKNRNQSNSNGNGHNERYINQHHKKSSNDRILASKSENNVQEVTNQHKNLMFARTNSDEYKSRSLSPSPPSSVKSPSPGIDKLVELKDCNGSSECADDSESTASASSGPSALSFSSDTGKNELLPPPSIKATSEQKVKENNVNTWINSNNFGMIRNGLSASAEQLNTRVLETSAPMIKRPPSVNEISTSKNHINHPANQLLNMPYDPAYPFDYYFARSDQAEMRIEPSNLKCGNVWDVLSKQMWDKFQAFQQTSDTYRSKMILWKELYNYVKGFPLFHQRAYPKWGLFLVGSTISGFGLDSSDVDMCLVLKTAPQLDPRTEAMITLNSLKSYLVNSGSSFQGFYLINAKVPILRFRDATNKIEVDLNYNNCIGVRNTHLLHCYGQLDWRLRPLVIIVKLWAQFHNINDARNSTISSYSLVLMVIHFLQYACSKPVLPCLHKMYPGKFQTLHDITTIDMMETLDTNWKSQNQQPLGELFLRFLDYYSNFNYVRNAISIRTGGVLPIEECKNVKNPKNDPNHWQTLCIEEPFDLTNTARSTYDGEIFEKIKSVFHHSWRLLKEYKTLDILFQDPLFVQQHNMPQYQQHFHQINPQMMNYIIYNTPKGAQLISTSPINEITS